MFIIDNFFHSSNNDRSTSDHINFISFLLLLLILRFESLLVLNELLFHCQVILDAFLAKQSKSAFG